MKTLAYLRVSTNEQGVSGLGLADQLATVEAEVGRRGWAPACVVTEVASAKRGSRRPELEAVLDALDRGDADVLVVTKIDRLSRSNLDFFAIRDRAERKGWELVVIDSNVDTTTASGRLMLNMQAVFAEHERDMISERTKAALAAKKAQGYRLGRPVTLSEDVRGRIATERAEGRTLAAIAEDLTAEGVPTARGGARWYPSTVKAVLRSLDLDAVAA